jgi:hypothetical protein
MKWWRWSLFFVPGLLALVISIWLNLSDLPNPILYLRAELSALIFIFGMILLVIGAVALFIWYRWQIASLDIVLTRQMIAGASLGSRSKNRYGYPGGTGEPVGRANPQDF